MTAIRRLLAAMLLASAVAVSVGQEPPESGDRAEKKRIDPRDRYEKEGIWPTQRQVELFFDRVADSMIEFYDLDEEQFLATRQIVRETLPKFLQENKRDLKALLNEFIDAQLSGEPPDPNSIQDWAQRAVTMLEKFDGVVQEVTDGMREFLTEDQLVKLDAEHAAFKTGVSIVQNKLYHWSEGGFNPETDWITDPRVRREREHNERVAMRAEMQKARESVLNGAGEPGSVATADRGAPEQRAGSGPASRTAPRDEWEMYVVSFIRRYDLNHDQEQQAYAILRAKQEERDDYLARKGNEIKAVGERLAKAQTDKDKQEAQTLFDKLNRPIARAFEQLRDKLDTIPTRKQRKDAARMSADRAASEAPQTQPVAANP